MLILEYCTSDMHYLKQALTCNWLPKGVSEGDTGGLAESQGHSAEHQEKIADGSYRYLETHSEITVRMQMHPRCCRLIYEMD